MFYAMFDNPWTKAWYSFIKTEAPKPGTDAVETPTTGMDRDTVPKGDGVWLAAMEKGGFLEGVTRIMLAVAGADKVIDRREYLVAEEVVRSHPEMRKIDPSDFKMMVKDQARILQTDRKKALKSLTVLLPGEEDRIAAMEIATRVAMADDELADEEQTVLSELREVLAIETA